MVRLDLLNVGLVEETGGILLVLRAPEMARLLVIETGLLEGQAVALEAQGLRTERPLTQDLLHTVITALGARVREVRIREFEDEAFHADLVIGKADGTTREVVLDARPSDAIALALRAEAPMYIEDRLMTEMGIPDDKTGRFAELYPDDDDDEDGDQGERTIH